MIPVALLRYTALRLALFLGTAALLYLVGVRNLFVCALVAILVSGIVSVVALKRVRSEVGASLSRVPAPVEPDITDETDLEVGDDLEANTPGDPAEPQESAAAVAPKASKRRRPSALTRISDRIDAAARAEDEADDAERVQIGHPLSPIARPDLPGWEHHLPDVKGDVDAAPKPSDSVRTERQGD